MPRRIERWVTWAGAFLLPLAYSSNTYDGYVLPKLLLARWLLLALLACRLVRLAAERRLSVRRSALDLAILAMLASNLVSSFFADNVNVAVFGTYSRYDGLITTLTYAGLFWLVLQTLDSADAARALLRVMLASGYAVAVVAALQCLRDSLSLGEVVPAFGTLGQKNALGAFIVLLLPIAYVEVVSVRTWAARALALNALAMLSLALVLTFSRSAWAAGAAGLALAVVGAHRLSWRRLAVAGGAIAAVALAGIAVAATGVAVERGDLLQLGDRPVVWSDTLKLIASRPLVGVGPDNFGLVFPTFQSTDLHQPWDKAHAEVLQIAATQGLLGVAAYIWLLGAVAIAFWKGPRDSISWGAFTGVAAYEATLQLNFTALAAAFPFWVFLAAAVVVFGATRDGAANLRGARWPARAAAAACLAAAAASTVPAYVADADLRAAVVADYSGRSGDAVGPADAAMAAWPFDSVYATEAANVAFERGDWSSARDDYLAAARLGTFDPAVYRNLALADLHLGRFDEGRMAARRAYDLDRFDPANRALLLDFGGGS